MSPENDKAGANSPEYCGRILNGSYGSLLKERTSNIIARFKDFDKLDVPIMTYISAWLINEKIIWYEFVSRRFIQLFQCQPHEVASLFREAICDHRVYKYVDTGAAIKENVLDRDQLLSSQKKLRDYRRKTGLVDAVYKIRLPGGREVWLKDRGNIETYKEDGICLSPGCLTDITKVMMQKDLLSEQNIVVSRDKSLLVEAERHEALGQISSQVFHAIKNPIVAIGGLAKRLLKKENEANLKMYAEVIAKDAAKLERVLDDLFQFTHPMELQRQEIEPIRLVKNALALLKNELDQNNITIRLDAAAERLPTLVVDVRHMEEALVHIIKNGIEAHPEQGRIDLRLCTDKENVIIIVKDYGLGIRPTHKDRVAEPFYTTKVYGSGFGLSIAKKYIQLHQGTLQIVSAYSSGTKVVVKLPFQQLDSNTEKG